MEFSESLKKSYDIRNVYEKGRSLADSKIVMYTYDNGLDLNRICISAGKKIGNSVERHRFARLVREAYRLNEQKFKRGKDIIVIMRMGSKGRKMQDIEESVLKLAKRHNILKEK